MASLLRKISFSPVHRVLRASSIIYACENRIAVRQNIVTPPSAPPRYVSRDVIPARGLLTSSRRWSEQTSQQSAENQDAEQDDDAPEMSEEEIRQCVLSSALEFVPEHGWSTHALAAGAAAEGLPEIAHGMFSRGGVELVEYFYRDCNHKLADRLCEEADKIKSEGGKLQMTKFIREALEHRLRMIHPYMDTWSEVRANFNGDVLKMADDSAICVLSMAMGLQALPQNAPHSWQNLLDLCDDIWYYAGDKSTDMNWYSKRLSLAYVYKATEIYMLQDESDDYQDTWAFLDNRLHDIKTMGKAVSQGQNLVGTAFDVLKAATTVGLNMAGLNRHDRRTR